MDESITPQSPALDGPPPLEGSAPGDQVGTADHELDMPAAGAVCTACAGPTEPMDAFCGGCGSELAADAAATTDSAAHTLHCQSCGARIQSDLDARSFVCPFCAASIVMEIPEEQAHHQRPEFVIPFAIPRQRAQRFFREWLGRRTWFRPGDLSEHAAGKQMKGIYLPFWSFSVHAHSDWDARIGEYWYRTETYTVTVTRNGKTSTEVRTRQVQETEWWPLSGRYQQYHSGYLVSASTGLPQKQADAVKPFRLEGMKRYQPRYLAGWMSEEYAVDKEAASDRSGGEFHRRQGSAVAAFLPGDTHTDLGHQTTFSGERSDLVLLPLYIFSYRYSGRVYRFLVNAQTGRAWGEKPYSTKRIVCAVLVGLGAVGLIFLLALFLSGALR